MKGIYIFLAEGYEPLEALAPMDILRRAGVAARFVSVTADHSVKASQGYAITADLNWDEFCACDDNSSAEGCMIFPGGMPGSDNLAAHDALVELMRGHFDKGGLTAAICAAPARMLAARLGHERVGGRRMTAYAGFEGELEAVGAVVTGGSVVRDGNMITAKGPGLAMDFGFALVDALCSEEVRKTVRKGMMLAE